MELPTTFSQESLQNYLDCRRRFQLRHIQKLNWPAIGSQPALESERAMKQGVLFHRLVQQYLEGIPVSYLDKYINGDDLIGWWNNFRAFSTDARLIPGTRLLPEISLSASLADVRLIAKCDLISLNLAEKIQIYDWKTSPKHPLRSWLEHRMQTRLYPYLVLRASASIVPGMHVDPQNIELIYWFSNYPDQPESFHYSEAQFKEDEAFLIHLINEIQTLDEKDFSLTSDLERCKYCIYRSLCNRGELAGQLSETEAFEGSEAELLNFDFEQITEIAY